MHILLYDPNLWSKWIFKDAILFYINNSCKGVYCQRIYVAERSFFAQLEQNRVFRGRLEFGKSQYLTDSELTTPHFTLLFERRRINVAQTVLISPDCENIANDAHVKEILNVYDVPAERNPTFNVNNTIKVMSQCQEVDTLRLYMLSALPYLNNCQIPDITTFADIYNTKLRMLLI